MYPFLKNYCDRHGVNLHACSWRSLWDTSSRFISGPNKQICLNTTFSEYMAVLQDQKHTILHLHQAVGRRVF